MRRPARAGTTCCRTARSPRATGAGRTAGGCCSPSSPRSARRSRRPPAAGLLLAGCGAGLWLKAAWIGRLERADEVLLWVRVDWLRKGAGRPAGRAVKAFRTTGIAAGDAAPGGARRRLVKAA
ncbi:hypothetical protein RKD39_004128 [Streptomyces albogriseolus]